MALSFMTDPRFLQGKALLESDKPEDAIEFWGDLLEQRVKVVGSDLEESLAPIYYEYGCALLSKAEDDSSVLGGAMQEAEVARAKAALEAQSEGAETSGETEEAAEAGEEPEEEVDDMQLAWENLECAQKILATNAPEKAETEEQKQYQLLLAKVHLRLGDFQMLNGAFAPAIAEFQTCLALRQAILPPISRPLADVHHMLAEAHLYLSSVEDTPPEGEASAAEGGGGSSSSGAGEAVPVPVVKDKEELFRKYLEHLEATCAVFKGLIEEKEAEIALAAKEASSTEASTDGAASNAVTSVKAQTTPEEELKDMKSLLEELQETVTAASSEAALLKKEKDEKAVTTIGFGQQSTSNAAPVLVVKRKRKGVDSTENGNAENGNASGIAGNASGTAGNSSGIAAPSTGAELLNGGGDHALKKQKVEEPQAVVVDQQ